MSAVRVIAGVTWRQALRDRVLHLLVGGAVAAIGASWAIGWVTPTDPGKVITDFTLAALSVFSVLVAVVLGGRLIREDVERRTLYTICAKDVSRGAVILGKYLGLLGAFATSLAVAAAVAALYSVLVGGNVGWGYLAAVLGLFGELAILVAGSVFFSTVSSSVVAAGSTLALWVIGHSVRLLPWFADAWSDDWLSAAARGLYVMLPNLTFLDFRSHAAHDLPVPGVAMGLALVSTVFWSVAFLGGAWVVFREKDL